MKFKSKKAFHENLLKSFESSSILENLHKFEESIGKQGRFLKNSMYMVELPLIFPRVSH